MFKLRALLLVGGYATRLRPLSLNRPKCLFPLRNKPLIDYLIENLARAGCSEAILAVNNQSEIIESYLGSEKYGIKLLYSREDMPLGTGGPIKIAEEKLRNEDFLVLNGDILNFINYHELMEKHLESRASITLTLKQVEDPTRYGVARLQNNTIKEFVEKPTRENAPSSWINAGCYALSSEILDMIPSGRKVSLEREIFPELAAKGQLNAYRYHEKWIDIGVPEDYLKADKMLRSASSSIGDNNDIGINSSVLDSIIWENTIIGKNTHITDSIIANNCIIGDNVMIQKAVIADNVRIDDNITIPQGTKIWPNSHVETNITLPNLEIK